MDEDLNAGGQAGAPPGPSDADYQNIAMQLHGEQKKKAAEKPPVEKPPVDNKVVSFFKGLVPDRNTPELYGKAIARGVVNAGREAATTFNAINEAAENSGKKVHAMFAGDPVSSSSLSDLVTGEKPKSDFVEKWYNTPLFSAPMTDAEVEAMLGKRHEGAAGVVENIAQFSTGMLVAGEVLKPLQMGALAARTLAGGLSDATVFNPYQKRLSSIVSEGPSWIAEPVKALFVTKEDDSPIVARLKAGAEGIVTGFTLDRLIAGVKVARALTKSGGKVTAEVETALAEAKAIKHDPAVHGPVVVEPTPAGQFVLSGPSSDATKLSGMLPDGAPGISMEPAVAGQKILKVAARDANGKPIGVLVLQKTGDNSADVFVVHVAAEARRKGIATQMYDAAEKAGLKLRSGQSGFTAEGKAFIEKRTGAAAPVSALQLHADELLNPTFKSQAEAEGVAASINQAALNSAQPRGVLTPAQVMELTAKGKELTASDLATAVHPDFNFNYTASPVEVKSTIQAISDVLPLPKTVKTHAQTVALAEDLIDGKSGEDIVQMLRDKNVSAEGMENYIHAARTYLYSAGAKVAQLGRAADAQPENGIAFGELKTAMEHLVDVHESAAGLSRTAGRALEAHKIVVGAESQVGAAVEAGATQEAAVAAKDVLAKMSKEDMLAFARLVRMSEGDPNAILQMMRAQGELAAARTGSQSALAGVMDRVNSIRAEAMLSGPKTHIVNFISNSLTALQMPAEMWWGGVVSGNRAMRQQGTDQFVGVFLQLRDAISAGARAFRTGTNVLDEAGGLVRDAGVNSTSPISGLAQVAHLPSRMLMSSDELFKTLNYRASVRAQSLRLARAEGITDAKEIGERVAADMKAAFSATGSAVNPKALTYARTATFQNPLEYGYGKDIQELVQKHPAMRLIMPFVRTPVNLFRYAWQRTPGLNLIQKEIQADLRAGGERQALAIAKTQMGMVLYSGAAMLAYKKVITGGGPSNPELRKQWLAAGNQPYSIKTPTGYISYARANPALTAVGIVADLVEMSGETSPEDTAEHAAAFVASVARNITNQTFMQGVSDALDAASSGRGKAMMNLFANTAGSFVPNIARQLNPDDTLRETRGMIDELKARVPGLSSTLEPRRNILGEPIMKPPGYANQALNPFTFMGAHEDSTVQQQMVDLGKAMSMPSERQGKVKLTDRDTYDNGTHQSPYDRMLELQSKGFNGGPNLRTKLTQLMKSETWKNAGEGTEAYVGGKRFWLASQIISNYQDHALMQVQKEYPKLKDAMHEDKKAKMSALRAKQPSSEQRPQFLTQ